MSWKKKEVNKGKDKKSQARSMTDRRNHPEVPNGQSSYSSSASKMFPSMYLISVLDTFSFYDVWQLVFRQLA